MIAMAGAGEGEEAGRSRPTTHHEAVTEAGIPASTIAVMREAGARRRVGVGGRHTGRAAMRDIPDTAHPPR